MNDLSENLDKFIMTRDSDGTTVVNIPRGIRHHNTGWTHEWGYVGSGPADLALNILQYTLTQQGYTGPTAKAWDKQEYFVAAWRMHQEFKSRVIAIMPREGGIIYVNSVEAFIKQYMEEHPEKFEFFEEDYDG